MKIVSKLIPLYLPNTDMLLIMATLTSIILLLKTAAEKFSGSRRKWILNKKHRAIESNMWAIE